MCIKHYLYEKYIKKKKNIRQFYFKKPFNFWWILPVIYRIALGQW